MSWFFKKNNHTRYDVLEIPQHIYDYIHALTLACPVEISGFGTTTKRREGEEDIIRVESLHIYPQECSAGGTVLDDEALTKAYLEMQKNHEVLNFWWHSHVNFSTFFSGTDTSTMEDISKDGGFVVGLCTNKKGSKVATVYEDGEETSPDLEIRIIREMPKEVRERAEQDVANNVKPLVEKSRYNPYKKYGRKGQYEEYRYFD